VLSVIALVTSAALASFALTVDSTARAGLVDGAWQTVGADARVDLSPVGTTPMLSAAVLVDQIAAEQGVEYAVAAAVTEQMPIAHESTIINSHLVVVDAAAFSRLRASTPLPDAPDLERLATAGPRDAAPPSELAALVRSSDGSLQPGMHLELLRSDAPEIRLVAVGVAPMVGNNDTVIIVDAAAADAAGLEGVPNTVWATGPGAERAATTVAARQNPEALLADAVLRTHVLEDRRTAPLTSGLLTLAWICAATILALGLVGFVLSAATTFPDRWHTLSRLRTLGLRSREARWVAAGELLPPALFAAVAGPLLGLVLARLVIGPLALKILTVQTSDPVPVVPWLGLGLVAVAFLIAVAVVVPVESALGRRRRLGEVLRAGGG
jgi:putative ABC transport system permease protein